MTKVIYYVLCCYAIQGVLSQNTVPTLVLTTQIQSNQDELPQLLKTLKSKKDKFTCVLNLLKSALAEEIDNSQCNLDETTPETLLNNLSKLLEEEQKKENESEIQNLKTINETVAKKAMYNEVEKKIASALTKPNNNTYQTNVEMPSLIPIFKPKTSKIELKSSMLDCSPKPRAVSFIPEKIVQTNLNLITNQPMFNIPCQKAVDVLDMTNIAVPQQICGNVDLIRPPNLNFKPPEIMPNFKNQEPVSLSVNCADSDDTVAVLFKPKAISLMQLYGNLLKNITITVLVPYHMSKLASN